MITTDKAFPYVVSIGVYDVLLTDGASSKYEKYTIRRAGLFLGYASSIDYACERIQADTKSPARL